MTAPSPMVTPGSTVTPPPNHTSLPTVMGAAYSQPARRRSASIGWLARVKAAVGADHHVVPKGDRHTVQNEAIMVDIKIISHSDVIPVVAPEDRIYHNISSGVSKELGKYPLSGRTVPAGQDVELLTQGLAPVRSQTSSGSPALYRAPESIFSFSVMVHPPFQAVLCIIVRGHLSRKRKNCRGQENARGR